MFQPSKSSLLRLGAAVGSSVLTTAAFGATTKKWGPATLAGSAVLASQAAGFIGDVNLGRAVSRTRLLTETVGRDLRSRDGYVAVEQELRALQAAVRSIQATPAAVAKKVARKMEVPTAPAADPKTRRTGAPVNFVLPAEVKARKRVPLVGSAAEEWVKSRTGGEPYVPVEPDLPYRAKGIPFADEVPVAMIADDFTFHSFESEFHALRLTPSNWRSIFTKYKPAVFFCESAWQGGSPKTHPWQGKVYASVRWPKENRSALLDILDYCHKHQIPTVFWNKEDPTHYSDRINDFVRTAALFDYVFTTAEECVEGYKKDAGCNYVDVLPFAVQPKLFNPMGTADATDSVNFAGTWYGMYPKRCEAQAAIMDQVLDAGLDLVIYDRMKSSPLETYRYPERFEKFTREAIPYTETAQAYKQSKYGITMNTVADSRTMFARRVFELAASGSVVLSNDAKGVREFFGDSVIYADSDPEALASLTPEKYRDLQRRALNIALNNTYRHRAEKILRVVGISFQSRHQQPTLICSIRSMSEFSEFINEFESRNCFSELLVIVESGAEQSLEFKLLQRRDEHVTIISERSIVENEFRVRSFMQSGHFVYADRSSDIPEVEEIEEMLLHTSYFEGQIKFAPSSELRYKSGPAPLSPASLVATSFVKEALTGREIPTYEI
ncbi:glycosyltransferase [Corynebacterium sp. NML 120412]|uniref:CgeB family protein n=1 Tax=Corynebacterium sp. NML 120412 TaxID=2029401 RepID=UPI0011779638|nr:glycosyltransferase [Corynebacterium sp. NML 120412]